MTVGAGLLGYAALLGVLGPLVHRHDGWLTRAPRLGAVLLLAAAWSVLVALLLAGLTVALPGTALSSGLSDVLGACIVRLRTAYATPGGSAVSGAGLTLTGVVVLRLTWAGGLVLRDRRAERRRQQALVGLCGRVAPQHGAVVLDEPRPAAYCLPGRRRTVVVTSGTVELLTGPQLSAVLAHERAHLRARHHRLLAAAALAARTVPDLPFLRDLPRHVRRLLEMHADDLAAAGHDPEILATALVAVATAGRAGVTAPSTALAAADGDTAARVRRLLLPPESLNSRRRRTVRAAVAALGLIPVLMAATPAGIAVAEPPVRTAPAVVAVGYGGGWSGPVMQPSVGTGTPPTTLGS